MVTRPTDRPLAITCRFKRILLVARVLHVLQFGWMKPPSHSSTLLPLLYSQVWSLFFLSEMASTGSAPFFSATSTITSARLNWSGLIYTITSLTFDPCARVMWWVISWDNVEKREGLPSTWSEVPESKIHGPIGENWEGQTIRFLLGPILTKGQACDSLYIAWTPCSPHQIKHPILYSCTFPLSAD